LVALAMGSTTRDLTQIEREVVAAKRILKEQHAKRATTRNVLKRVNAGRVISTVSRSLDNLRQHRHVLEELASGSVKKGRKKKKATGKKKTTGKRGKSGRSRAGKAGHTGPKRRAQKRKRGR